MSVYHFISFNLTNIYGVVLPIKIKRFSPHSCQIPYCFSIILGTATERYHT